MNDHTRALDASWGDCPAGTLLGVVRQDQLRRQRRRFTIVIAPILAILLVGAATPILLKIRQLNRNQPGTLSCRQVAILLPEYATSTLPAATVKQVELHLRNCPACRERLRQLDSKEPHRKTSRTNLGHAIVAVVPNR